MFSARSHVITRAGRAQPLLWRNCVADKYLADAWLSICVTSEEVFAQHSLSDCVQWRQWLLEVSASLAVLVSSNPFPSSSCYRWSKPRHETSCLLEHCEVHMHCSMIRVCKDDQLLVIKARKLIRRFRNNDSAAWSRVLFSTEYNDIPLRNTDIKFSGVWEKKWTLAAKLKEI